MNTPLHISLHENILCLQLNHQSIHNPIGQNTGRAVIDACHSALSDSNVSALVITGGVGRSFSAGGDFNEVSLMQTSAEVGAWIDRTVDLYKALLKFHKPTIAAMDGYAIGIGLQLALSCDWRIATPESKHVMWELKHGIACTLGSYMLERHVGRSVMQQMVYGCDQIKADEAKKMGLVNEVVSREELLERAIEHARKLSDYPTVPFQRTKQAINRPFLDGLVEIAQLSKEVHAASFQALSAQKHFEKILKSSSKNVTPEKEITADF